MFRSQKFRIVSWNIEKGIKFDKIAKILCEKIPADIYALQEVDIHVYRSKYRDVAADLASALGMSYVFGIEFREFAQEGYESKHAFHGQEFITRFPLNYSETFYFPHRAKVRSLQWFHKPLLLTRLPRLKTKLTQNVGSVELGYTVANFFQPREGARMALFGEFEIGGKKLFVYNAHLECHTKDEEKALQIQNIMHHIDANKRIEEDDAVIILGDLNTTLGASSPAIQAAEKRGFHDALAHFADKDVATCTTGQRLDWILIKNLRVTNASVYGGGFAASDHLPIVADLEFV